MATVTVDDIGARIAEHLTRLIGERNYQLWFDDTRVELDEGETMVTLHAPHRFAADWIAKHFKHPLHQAARASVGGNVELQIRATPGANGKHPPARPRPAQPSTKAPSKDQPGAAPSHPPTPGAGHPRRGARPSAQPLRHCLEDFVVGPCNELAFKAGRRLVEDDAAELNPLFVHGACGVGKTHLLQGLSRRFAETHPGKRWRYCTAEQFTNEYIEAVRGNQLPAFRAKLRRLSLLVVDDVHFLSDKRGTQSEFLHTFDSIDLHGAKLVLASDCHPKLIGKLNEALLSRCIRGMVVEMEPPDRQTRQQLVEALAARRNLELEPGVVPLLAEQTAGSVRELEGTLTTLKALSMVGRDHADPDPKVGRALVGRVLGHNATRRPQPVRLETILQQVCDHLDVAPTDAKSKTRRRQVVLARSLAIYLARQMTNLSFPELATAMNRPNHSSVITAFNRVKAQVETRAPITIDPQRGPTTIDQLVQNLRHRIETAPEDQAGA